jgi:2-polyprenyl-3-methyl-5-hydroxy-6-metoxy-1,4-benzoquinol methylase
LLYLGTLEDLAEVEDNQEYFDAVVMSEVVEHVNNLDDFLANSSRLLKASDSPTAGPSSF